jgi:Bacterial Ig domain/Abnormal spindle-like microcephaly-assoc'd, ASPM-SPD-2-Hydin/Bacterial Ig-like domain (group 2)
MGDNKMSTSRNLAGRLKGKTAGSALVLLAVSLTTLLSGCAGILSGTKSVPQVAILFTPSSLNFGNVAVGKKVSQGVVVKNVGPTTLNITAANLSNSQFSVSGVTFPFSLVGGATANLTISINGSTRGSITGTLTLQTDAGTYSSPMSLSASEVSANGQLGVNPASVDFGPATIGTKASSTVTLTNSGGSDLTISMITVNGAAFGINGITTPKTISSGQSTTMSVSFAPTTTGAQSGSISINSNDPQSPATITLSGSGTTSAVGRLTLSPASLAFGNVTDGSSSVLSSTITNSGQAVVHVSQVNTTGSAFSASGVAAGTTIAAGQTASLKVRFAPTAPGATTGSVSIISDGSGSPSNLTLSGTGVSSGPSTPPTVSITAPVSGSTVSGTITVTANASSNVGVAGVQFKVDSNNIGAEDTAGPYNALLNTTGLANGSHTLTAVARDTAGNTATSSAVTITVSNSASSGHSVLATLAASMAPGTWAPLSTNSFDGVGPFNNIMRPQGAGSILEYTDKAGVWNPINKTVMVLGAAHNLQISVVCGESLFLNYTDATNTWGTLPNPCPNFDTSSCGSKLVCNLGHTYEHQTINPATGDFYHRELGSGNVMVFSQSTQAWSECSVINPSGSHQNNGGLQYFPERDSLVYIDGDWGVWELSLAPGNCTTNQWKEIANTFGTGGPTNIPTLAGIEGYNQFNQYSPMCHCLMMGGGNGTGTSFYKYDASGNFTHMKPSPMSMTIPHAPTSGTVITTDPVTGIFLVWDGNPGAKGTAWEYNPILDLWSKTGISAPMFPGPDCPNNGQDDGVCETIGVPISTYGVVMMVQVGSANTGPTSVYLYKHTSGAPPMVSVTVSPTSANLQSGLTQQFDATVTGSSNTAVTWTASGGTISVGGLFTALASAGTFTVTATSVADTTKSASATVTVTSGTPVVSVAISPTAATLQTNATQQFTATVTGATNSAVTWTATGGTISSTGLYTAPASAGAFTVTATSVADTSKSASAAVSAVSGTGAINGWTSRIAGINVPGGPASIVSSQDFDTTITQTCSAPCSTYAPGKQSYIKYYGNGTPATDCTISADGPCSLKFTINNGSFQGDAGLYDYNFSPNFANGVGQFGAGQEFYIQYKERFDPAILGKFSGAGGLKHDITTEGDTATKSAGDCSNSPAEIVTIQDLAFNGPWMYVNCGFSSGSDSFTKVGYEPLELGGAPGTNFLDQNASGCPHYNGQGGIPVTDPSCFLYVGNEWFTVQKHIKIGTFGSPNSVIEQWFAHAGSPAALVSQAADADVPNDGSGGASGKYGKIQLSTYNTGANWSVNTAAWFDDLIVSTRRIPDPDVATPNAPDSLRLSNISSSGVTVNWRVNSQNATAQDDTGFLVERCVGNGATCFANPQSGFTVIATTAAGASSYIDTSVAAGTTYTYRIGAKNAAGHSAYTIAQCFNGGNTCGGTVAVP